jgi:integrase
MLRWNMVNLVEGLLIVGVSKTQGGQGRIVPLSPVALAALREWRGRFLDVLPEHFVFPTERISGTGPRRSCDGMDPTRPIGSWKTAFHGALRKSGVECRWHDLRHSFASRMGEGGVAEQTLLALCGWMSRKMLERYSHTKLEAKRLAIDALDDYSEVGTNMGTVQWGEPFFGPYVFDLYGAPREIRTPDLLIRSQSLYPAELWAHKGVGLTEDSKRVG